MNKADFYDELPSGGRSFLGPSVRISDERVTIVCDRESTMG
jgi:hypothetical protein